MAPVVRRTDDPAQVLEEAGELLTSEPVLHNLILGLLQMRVVRPADGRYWIVECADDPVGVVLQSPTTFAATSTPMSVEHITAAVDAIVDEGVDLPGFNAEAATAARFAGHWTERTGRPARPLQGQRIYALETVAPVPPTPGSHRRGQDRDRGLLIEWMRAFQREADEGPTPAAEFVDRRLEDGDLWLWDDDGPVAMTGVTGPVAGTVRIGPVYTPPERRGRGYASALVAALSDAAVGAGNRCMLYTDLANPVSNSIYRAIGYRAVAEALRYGLEGG